ncbi:MAG: hypothetical protein ACD_9C00104G0001 [uncultured bacterium]|nr:MAG: hypothetical protein ACD_9C00104G0001 [uncultured bacterium]
MDTKEFIKKHEKLSKEANNFRYQMIVMVGGILTIFVAIHGDNNVSSLIKYGFFFLGTSLISGTIAIVLALLQPALYLFF